MYPGFPGVVVLESDDSILGRIVMPKAYPPEFRRRALDLIQDGRSVVQVAAGLGISRVLCKRYGTGVDRHRAAAGLVERSVGRVDRGPAADPRA